MPVGLSLPNAGDARPIRGTIGLPEASAAFALLTLYSYSIYYLFNHGWTVLQPNYVYLGIYLLSVLTYTTSAGARQAIGRHSALLCVLALLLVLMAVQFVVLDIRADGLGLFYGRLHFLLTMVAMVTMLMACTRLHIVIWTLGVVIAAGCIVNLSEFFLAGSMIDWMSNVPGRAAGLYENANDSAMFLVMGIPIVALNVGVRTRWAFYLITLAGAYVTFSRGGLVSWALFVALAELLLQRGRGWAMRALAMSLIAVCAIGAVSLFNADLGRTMTDALWPYLDANTSARIEFLSYDSTDERMAVLQHGLEAFAAAPLFGQGVGYTYSWDMNVSVHNMLVLMLAELGLVGGLWYLLFLFALWRYGRPYGALAFVVILVTGVLTHNHLERPAVAIAISLYVVAARLTKLRRTALPDGRL